MRRLGADRERLFFPFLNDIPDQIAVVSSFPLSVMALPERLPSPALWQAPAFQGLASVI
jgi:hypothetical protein